METPGPTSLVFNKLQSRTLGRVKVCVPTQNHTEQSVLIQSMVHPSQELRAEGPSRERRGNV